MRRGARCRTRGPHGWAVRARVERFEEPALLLLLRERAAHGYELLDALPDLLPASASTWGTLPRSPPPGGRGPRALRMGRGRARACAPRLRAHRRGPRAAGAVGRGPRTGARPHRPLSRTPRYFRGGGERCITVDTAAGGRGFGPLGARWYERENVLERLESYQRDLEQELADVSDTDQAPARRRGAGRASRRQARQGRAAMT